MPFDLMQSDQPTRILPAGASTLAELLPVDVPTVAAIETLETIEVATIETTGGCLFSKRLGYS